MKVLQYIEKGRPEIVDLPIPEPGEGQVLLKIEGIATCPHWDLHIMDGISMVPGGMVEYPYVRVMKTTGAMGEVVAMAASLYKKHDCTPRQVYQEHLAELKELMTRGAGREALSGKEQD